MNSDAISDLLGWFVGLDDLRRAPTNESALLDLGWVEVRANDVAGWKEWRRGTESGYSSAFEDVRAFEVVLKILWPEEGANFGSLYELFEAEYAGLVASVEGRVGASTYSSEFDERPVPMPGQFDRATVWRSDRGTVVVSFQHEDKEAPLRMSLWLLTGR
ncbi:hypothetical protein [Catellatospora citrea]|uniref:Uncharacterized protein n=1 Tax=Catellatospora citrea TaxID=53366 RepID=A0A8J3KLR3_9ACTN|nr:hypothetical protein [Catellatospora citrea]GIG01019.1 hypothetical protein Cci01nite_61120 [Catellatospora citrea]